MVRIKYNIEQMWVTIQSFSKNYQQGFVLFD